MFCHVTKEEEIVNPSCDGELLHDGSVPACLCCCTVLSANDYPLLLITIIIIIIIIIGMIMIHFFS